LEFIVPFQHKYGYIRDEHQSADHSTCWVVSVTEQ